MNMTTPSSLMNQFKRWKLMVLGLGGLKPKPSKNCWFCNEDFSIQQSEEEDSGWRCPDCQQYNGFTEDGDYDHPIPEQYDSPKDSKSYCQQKSFGVAESIICRLCHRNQVMKVGQLASFVPLSESSYNEEVDAYGRYLESVYRLCQDCNDRVGVYLQRQDDDILRTLDEDNLQVKQQSLVGDSSKETALLSRRRSVQDWLRWSFFMLCLLMAMVNTSGGLQTCLSMETRRLSHMLPRRVYPAVLYITNVFPLPLIQSTSPLPVFLGTGFCLLGLLNVGKTFIYVVDAVHILLWLVLLISSVWTTPSPFPPHTAAIYLILCVATTWTCLLSLKKDRQPRNVSLNASQFFRWKSATKEQTPVKEGKSLNTESENDKSVPDLHQSASPALLSSPSSISSSLSSPRSLSPVPAHLVGEPQNFFKPISSPPESSSSPAAFSSSSPAGPERFVSEDRLKATYEVVRDGLESVSLGLAKTSGSMSSIWSLPSILTSDPPSSPDSPLPTTTSTHPQLSGRDILSPSRLSFLSFSRSPSPGKFSLSSPASEADSGFVPDSSQHLLPDNLWTSTNSHNNQICPKPAEGRRPLNYSTPSLKQKQSFTKYRSDSNNVSSNSNKLGTELIASSPRNKEIMAPDSTSNENEKSSSKEVRRRRSERIAMRGKIIKPWPLKKSLSVNNMYDSPNTFDIVGRKAFVDQSLSGDGSGVKPNRLDVPRSSSFDKHVPDGLRKHGYMDRIAEFSDDEDMDSSLYRRNSRKLMRGETVKVPAPYITITTSGIVKLQMGLDLVRTGDRNQLHSQLLSWTDHVDGL